MKSIRPICFPGIAVLLGLLPALMILFLAGCGGDDSTQTAARTTSAAQAGNATTPMEATAAAGPAAGAPAAPVRLVFIHHSVGEDWLDDTKGGLGRALMENNYFVSDTNYGWGPPDLDAGENIGDHTDIGYWYDWFAGPHSSTYLAALYTESGQNTGSAYSRLASDPGGENEIVMFKSCFPNSALGGSPNDPPVTGDNPLRGVGSGDEAHTVGNAKGIYNDLLGYCRTRPDKLFIVVTAPPLRQSDTNAEQAANARAFNDWLAHDWLSGYPYTNVAVFDFYNVLTAGSGNYAAYPSEDSHPTAAGLQEATTRFIPFLNSAYQRWQGG